MPKKGDSEHSGMEWKQNRDAWDFYQDAIALALQTSMGMSTEAANRWLDFGEQNYTLSPEKLAGMVKQYLDSKGSNHHLVFMVDEVGQYFDSAAVGEGDSRGGLARY